MKKLTQFGDTIVEVMLAMSILSLILVTSWGMTNRATLIGLTARQRVDGVNQLKEQAELLKSQWAVSPSQFSTNYFTNPTPINEAAGDLTGNPCDAIDLSAANPSPNGGGSFYLRADSASVVAVSGVKTPDSNASMRIWVQRQTSNPASGGKYTDFYIRGCWETLGGRQTTDSSQILLRLNV